VPFRTLVVDTVLLPYFDLSFGFYYLQISRQYADITRRISRRRANRAYQAGIGYGGSNFALFATYALLLWYGSRLVYNGKVLTQITVLLCVFLP
jgi:hypothetical protein